MAKIERTVLNRLHVDGSLTVLPADKYSAMVVMTSQQYHSKM
jgi:hypothetical protein